LHRQEIKFSGDLQSKHSTILSLSSQCDECNGRIRLDKSALAELSFKIKISKSTTDSLCQEEAALASEECSFIKQISDIASKISETSVHVNQAESTAHDLQNNTVKLKNEIQCSLSNSRQFALTMAELQQRKLCLSDRTEKFQQLSSVHVFITCPGNPFLASCGISFCTELRLTSWK
jgi:peptidoglycan hydrolase CwlO-like protein